MSRILILSIFMAIIGNLNASFSEKATTNILSAKIMPFAVLKTTDFFQFAENKSYSSTTPIVIDSENINTHNKPSDQNNTVEIASPATSLVYPFLMMAMGYFLLNLHKRNMKKKIQ
ncbi:MAG: hypothetical protein Q7U47_13405 [Paludibacter sp.]|nr:hypothetical protein [Paludibacter sp.]